MLRKVYIDTGLFCYRPPSSRIHVACITWWSRYTGLVGRRLYGYLLSDCQFIRVVEKWQLNTRRHCGLRRIFDKKNAKFLGIFQIFSLKKQKVYNKLARFHHKIIKNSIKKLLEFVRKYIQ